MDFCFSSPWLDQCAAHLVPVMRIRQSPAIFEPRILWRWVAAGFAVKSDCFSFENVHWRLGTRDDIRPGAPPTVQKSSGPVRIAYWWRWMIYISSTYYVHNCWLRKLLQICTYISFSIWYPDTCKSRKLLMHILYELSLQPFKPRPLHTSITNVFLKYWSHCTSVS